jgi:hypothetical protein
MEYYTNIKYDFRGPRENQAKNINWLFTSHYFPERKPLKYKDNTSLLDRQTLKRMTNTQ